MKSVILFTWYQSKSILSLSALATTKNFINLNSDCQWPGFEIEIIRIPDSKVISSLFQSKFDQSNKVCIELPSTFLKML